MENKVKILDGMPAMTKVQWIDLYSSLWKEIKFGSYSGSMLQTTVDNANKIKRVINFKTI
jgi:hypothetical protein